MINHQLSFLGPKRKKQPRTWGKEYVFRLYRVGGEHNPRAEARRDQGVETGKEIKQKQGPMSLSKPPQPHSDLLAAQGPPGQGRTEPTAPHNSLSLLTLPG